MPRIMCGKSATRFVSMSYEQVSVRFAVDKLRGYAEARAAARQMAPCRSLHRKTPTELAVLVVEHHGVFGVRERHKSWKQADGVPIRFVKLLANIRRIQVAAFKPGFLLQFSERCLSGCFAVLNGIGNLAPLTDKCVISAQ